MIGIDGVKAFLRVTGSAQDVVITGLIATAEAQILAYCGDLGEVWPAPCVTAAYMLIAQIYDDRHAPFVDGPAILPLTVRSLLAPYRVFQ